jgi:hypothetical protein
MAKTKEFPWGEIQGKVELPQAVLTNARELALQHYAEAESMDFSGDEVEDYPIPGWMADRLSWFPTTALQALGFKRASKTAERLLATASASPHIDDIDGPCLLLVLYNDGLKFKQGKQAHVTQAGEWLVFNDGIKHEVKEGRDTSSYLVWSVPLKRTSNT